MRLYFFPGLLPLAPLVPWLLTAVGALAGVGRALRKRRGLGLVALACFCAAGGFAYHQARRRPSDADGTRLTPRDSLPALVIEKEAASEANITGGSDVSSPMSEKLLHERWFQLTPRRAISSPALAGDLLLIGTNEGTLDAYARSSGTLLWSLRKTQPVAARPLVASSSLAFVGEGLHTAITSSLTAISLPGGKPLWQREFIGHLEEPPLLDSRLGMLWQGTGPRGLWALDPRDGRVVWHDRIGHVDSRPLLIGDRLIVPVQPEEAKKETSFDLIDPHTGKVLASVPLPGQPWGSPALAGGTSARSVLVTTAIGQIGPSKSSDRGWAHRISLDRPRAVWSVELPGMPLPDSPVLPAKGLVFHTIKQGTLIALRIRDGSVAWSASLGSEIFAPARLILPSRGKPLLAAITAGGVLTLRDALTGTELDRLDVGRDATSSPLYSDGILYVATPGTLAAYHLNLR